MAVTEFPKKVIFVDDEQFINIWVVDFLESEGYEVVSIENVEDAILEIEKGVGRAIIIDLQVPVADGLKKNVEEEGKVFSRFPGLFLAKLARNKGFRDRQVIIYSVHENEEVSSIAKDKLNCTYLLKERPDVFSAELLSVLEYDPTDKVVSSD
ncbi:hypothetical protein M9H61_05850 [Thalassospira sp. GO-4]|jgi:CheY-like chemotaxis protein|uniref:hypothetical protein n=1 Tax=Thalassospira sp. GO-4 TaxID=2946605 RepID=UPI00202422A0|nr:hypothetical protein [Thalassospira sp. GO-4]URK19025.1 hypothetical protein M9H61_05850 [Thalassospira sp. GO-4]